MSDDIPEMTSHARYRWWQRFRGYDLHKEYKDARVLDRTERVKMAERFSEHHAHLLRSKFKKCFYLVSPCMAVFVVAPPNKVITVFPAHRDELHSVPEPS